MVDTATFVTHDPTGYAIVGRRAIHENTFNFIPSAFGSASDLDAPFLANLLPLESVVNIDRTQAISFRLDDAVSMATGQGSINISVTYAGPSGNVTEVIHDGVSFQQGYQSFSSVAPVGGSTTGAVDISVRRDDGWKTDPLDIKIIARDSSGNAYIQDISYVVSNPDLGPDTSNPTIGSILPITASTIDPAQVVSFATDDDRDVSDLQVYVTYPTSSELAYDSNAGGFISPYTGTATDTGTGYTFSFSRTNGWQDISTVIDVIVSDPTGNQTTATITYTISPPPAGSVDVTLPVVGNYDPANSASISRYTSISFDVTDNSGQFAKVFVYADYTDTLKTEIIFNGTTFASSFLASRRVAIANGHTYTVKKTGGWVSKPTFRIYAIDASGNEAV